MANATIVRFTVSPAAGTLELECRLNLDARSTGAQMTVDAVFRVMPAGPAQRQVVFLRYGEQTDTIRRDGIVLRIESSHSEVSTTLVEATPGEHAAFVEVEVSLYMAGTQDPVLDQRVFSVKMLD
jgi:hypothetical protein